MSGKSGIRSILKNADSIINENYHISTFKSSWEMFVLSLFKYNSTYESIKKLPNERGYLIVSPSDQIKKSAKAIEKSGLVVSNLNGQDGLRFYENYGTLISDQELENDRAGVLNKFGKIYLFKFNFESLMNFFDTISHSTYNR